MSRVKFLYLLLMFSLAPFQVFAQLPSLQFAFPIGSTTWEARGKIVHTSDGGCVIAGCYGNTVDMDPSPAVFQLTAVQYQSAMFLARYSSGGALVWAESIKGTSTDLMRPRDITLDHLGNIIVVGEFSGTVDFDPSVSTTSIQSAYWSGFIAKYTPTGNFLWVVPIGSSGNGAHNTVSSCAVDSLDNVIVTGDYGQSVDFDPSPLSCTHTAMGNNDIFVAKYSSAGSLLWAGSFGGSGTEEGTEVTSSHAGDVFVSGHFASTIDFDPSNGTAWITPGTSRDVFVARYDPNGNYLWAFGLPADCGVSSGETECSIILDPSGNCWITGLFKNTVDFDPSASGVANLTSAGGPDIYLAKYTTTGLFLLAKRIGSSGNDGQINEVAMDAMSKLYVCGKFSGSVDFDPSGSSCILTSSIGSQDAFYACYNSLGVLCWAFSINDGAEEATSVDSDGAGSVYASGIFLLSSDFNPGPGTTTLTSSGDRDIFVCKYLTSPSIAVTSTLSSICQGQSSQLQALVSGGSGNCTYTWSPSTGLSDTSIANPVATPAITTMYHVVVTQGTLTFNDSVLITVKIKPAVCLGTDTAICETGQVTLDAGPGMDAYAWSTLATTQTITVDSSGIGIGSKEFWVNVMKDNCSNSDTIRITVANCAGLVEIPRKGRVRIYPVPSAGQVTLEADMPLDGATLFLYNALGQPVRQFEQLSGTMVQISCEGLQNGVYGLVMIRKGELPAPPKILVLRN